MNPLPSRTWSNCILTAQAALFIACSAQPGLNSKADSVPIVAAPRGVPTPFVPNIPPLPAPATNTPRRQDIPVTISPLVADVLTLQRSGVDESVIKSFVANSTNTFNPTLEEIIYLNDVGVPGTLVSALIQQSTKTRESKEQQQLQAKAAANLAPPEPAKAPVVEPAAPVAIPQAPVVQSAPVFAPTPVAEPATTTTVVNTYFYEHLSPYGTWVEIGGYGRCWQPTVVVSNARWRPYCDRGRWVWTDQGWYWQSDYSWGWATFHYGRWQLDPNYGWVWVPGETWAPAWVSWRMSDTHCGWAPLPPHAGYRTGVGFTHRNASVSAGFEWNLGFGHYTFVALNRIVDHNPAYYAVPPTQVQNVYNQTIVNNYYGTNTTVVNHGVPVQKVAAATRTDIRTVTIRDLPTTPSTTTPKPDRLEKNGGEIVVYRSHVQSGATAKSTSLNVPSASVTKLGNPTVATPVSTPNTPSLTPRPALGNIPSPNFPNRTGQPVPLAVAATQPTPPSVTPITTQPIVPAKPVTILPTPSHENNPTPKLIALKPVFSNPVTPLPTPRPVTNTPPAVFVPAPLHPTTETIHPAPSTPRSPVVQPVSPRVSAPQPVTAFPRTITPQPNTIPSAPTTSTTDKTVGKDKLTEQKK